MPEIIETPVKNPEVAEPTVKDPKFNDFLRTVLKPEEVNRTPDMYACVLHNDPSTHFQVVIEALMVGYGLEGRRATQIMMDVHRGDRGVIVILTKEEADEKTAKAMQVAHQAGYTDFRITVEKEVDGDAA